MKRKKGKGKRKIKGDKRILFRKLHQVQQKDWEGKIHILFSFWQRSHREVRRLQEGIPEEHIGECWRKQKTNIFKEIMTAMEIILFAIYMLP